MPRIDERFVTFPPNTPSGRGLVGGDAPRAWPLLAQLPYTGPAAVDRPSRPSSPVNPPHAFVEAYELPELSEREPAARPASAFRREYRRIDAADRRLAPRGEARDDTSALATRVYRWHAALAPHAGIAAAAALILSATMLVWLTAGSSPASLDYNDALDQPNIWSSEKTMESQIGSVLPSAEDVGTIVPAEPAGPEAPRLAEAASDATPLTARAATVPPASPLTRVATSPSTAAATAEPAAPPADETTSVATTAPSPTEAPEPITPTPSALPYPVTDYASFDIALQAAELTGALGAVPDRPSGDAAAATGSASPVSQ